VSDDPGCNAASEGAPSADLRGQFARAEAVLRRAAPRLMCSTLRERCRVSDLVQSTLAEALRALPDYRGKDPSEFVGWTLRMLEHNAADARRRWQAGRRSIEREVASDDSAVLAHQARGVRSPSEIAIDREELRRMARAMRSLPADQRRVLTLVAMRGASHAYAAAAMGRSEGACRTLLARARSSLLVAVARLADGAE
jgi:RNA polymerase sigma-70 factor (ECF subfamily)